MSRYQYPLIGPDLSVQIRDLLTRRESVGLLGGRNVGKRYLIRLVYDRLVSLRVPVAVAAFLDDESDIHSRETQENSTDRFLGDIPGLLRDPEETLKWWQVHHQSGCLLIANVDALPAGAHRQFCQNLNQIGLGGILVTCEAHGAKSLASSSLTLPVQTVFLISRWEKSEFSRFTERYLSRLGFTIPDDMDKVIQKLYERTAGNIYILRILLWTAFDAWASREDREAPCLTVDDIPDVAVAAQVPWNHYLRHLTRLISHSPSLWPNLELLLGCGSIEASEEPDLLELTGLLIREKTQTGFRLRLPGLIIGGFLRNHFTARKLADLYAGADRWDAAFEKLKQLPESQRVRPAHLNDIADSELIVKRLGAFLYQESSKGLAAVRRRFREGCLYLLGFARVDFYTRLPQKFACWEYLDELSSLPPQCDLETSTKAVSLEGESEIDVFPVSVPKELLTFGAQIPSGHPDRKAAVVISSGTLDPSRASTGRMLLLRELFRAFYAAYGQAWNVENLQLRARRRSSLDLAVTNILAGLGKDVNTLYQAVRLAVDELRRTAGYKRVLVSLLNTRENQIVGFVEASDDPYQRLKSVTNYPLTISNSLQVQAITTGLPQRFVDAKDDPRAHRESAKEAELLAGVIVLLDTGREHHGTRILLGTLAVEPLEPLPPDNDELLDLCRFGMQLSGIIEQAERIQLLQAALDGQREPLAIYDRELRFRYANRPAAQLIGDQFPHGWHNPETMTPIDLRSPDHRESAVVTEARNLARTAFKNGGRMVTRVRDGGQVGIVIADVIPDEEAFTHHRDTDAVFLDPDRAMPPLFGVFCEGQDLTYLSQIFESLTQVLDRIAAPLPQPARWKAVDEDVIDGIGQMLAKLPGAKMVTFARYDPSADSFRFERQYRALSGVNTAFGIPPHAASGFTRMVLEKQEPLTFYLDWGEFEDGASVVTKKGLSTISVRHHAGIPDDVLEGGIWIELPLQPGGEWIGKMMIICPVDFNPHDFVFLQFTTKLLSHLLGTLLKLAADYQQRDVSRQAAVKRSLQDFTHHILRPLKSTGITLEKLAKTDSQDPQFKVHQDRLQRAIFRFTHYARLACNTQDFTSIVRRQNDLREIVEKALALALEPGSFEVDCQEGIVFTGQFDSEHFLLAVSELAENANKYGRSDGVLKITARLSTQHRWDRHCLYRCVFEDQGSGIPADQKQTIFQRGVRLNREIEGQGDGLAYVERVVKEHQGHIRECGEYGKGAQFVIEVPSMEIQEN